MIIKEKHSLKYLNTFGINVKAEKLVIIEEESDIKNFLNQIASTDKVLILGSGSNILFTKDYKGSILKSEIGGIKEIHKNKQKVFIEAGSGVLWDDLVNYCVNKGYGGIENLSLIPGTVGAAPIQNIGAYGAELKDVFQELEGINLESGKRLLLNNDQCKFGYRDSIFKRELRNKIFITKVVLKLDLIPKIITSHSSVCNLLTEDEKITNDIKKVREVIINIRKSKLPDPSEVGNAGSFFKNPIINKNLLLDIEDKYGTIPYYKEGDKVKIPAGWLIEKAGFKGKRYGNVGVHNKQALVLVNYNKGTGKEILKLAEEIQQTILNKFNINLETEVNIV